ncbi:MAG TPA: RNA polymerase factor sigma-54, partial [Gammaproteobacteria bacterium]|nr:RNA polymerase factor sigma-54 [Gammaproteobacteria bacterium]
MLKPSLQLRLSQQLTMTPQLQQAIRLLQLPVMELQTQIQEALDQNVMLEVDESAAPESEAPESIESLESMESDAFENDSGESDGELGEAALPAPEWEDVQRTGPSEAPRSNEPRSTFEYADRSQETLRDHLLW